MIDISISHFSCIFRESDPNLPMYEKVSSIQISMPGMIFSTDGVVFIKRLQDGELLYVFIFRQANGQDGLDSAYKLKVNEVIYNFFLKKVNSLLDASYLEKKSEFALKNKGDQCPSQNPIQAIS